MAPLSMFLRLLLVLFFWVIVLPVMAEKNAENGEPGQEEQSPSGKVTIRGAETDVINEFRINGQLYMIRITPSKGAPYYLVDSDGDGDLETRWNELAPELLIPSWVLLRW